MYLNEKFTFKIFLEGAYGKFKENPFASDRVTDMEMRNAILTGQVKPTEKSISCLYWLWRLCKMFVQLMQ